MFKVSLTLLQGGLVNNKTILVAVSTDLMVKTAFYGGSFLIALDTVWAHLLSKL